MFLKVMMQVTAEFTQKLSNKIQSLFHDFSGPVEGERIGAGLQPPHLFENYKELLRKSVFIPLSL